jgi:hypothetical protein
VKLICYPVKRKIAFVLRGVAGFAQIWGVDKDSGGSRKSESQRAQRRGGNTEVGRRFRGGDRGKGASGWSKISNTQVLRLRADALRSG